MTQLKITNQAYNREIKEMFKIINKELELVDNDLEFNNNHGTHSGRDTFISQCVEKGVDWKTILKWVGQSSYEIMDRYIKTTDKYQEEKMKKVF